MRRLPKPPARSEAGAGWIVTFADLMSLLLTFFILLLSFSEMDIERYQQMALSLAASFGVQAISGAGQVGGNVIFGDQPKPADQKMSEPPTPSEQEFEPFEPPEVQMLRDQPEPGHVKQIDPNIERLTEHLIEQLQHEILSNSLSVSYDADKVVVRFSEATTFPSGSEILKEEMLPILEKIENVLAGCAGEIIVSGYTDDLPVRSSRFRSNWDLSAARAVSVVHQLVLNKKIDANRVSAAGRAETNALVPNDSPESRAKNRRVEISVFDPACEHNALQF